MFLNTTRNYKTNTFKLTYIYYDIIKYGIARMECVEHKTDFGRKIMNIDDIEDFKILKWP